MKLIKIKITHKSSFASLPTGDMIFGHFAKFLYLDNDNRLDNYLQQPSIIFSDFLPDNYSFRPALPLSKFNVDIDDKKDFRKKEFISFENLQSGNLTECEEVEFFKEESIIKNSINRKSFSTDDSGIFAPYSIKELFFINNIVLYALFDEDVFSQKEIEDILSLVGRSGFGKKSSIGKGQFEVKIDTSFTGFRDIDSNYYVTLSPTIFNKDDNIKECYYDVWSKFGKFHSSNTPFKKPVVFANHFAVVKLANKKEFIGKSINNSYDTKKPSFIQGYSIVVPFEFE